jgi:hypothetical protein
VPSGSAGPLAICGDADGLAMSKLNACAPALACDAASTCTRGVTPSSNVSFTEPGSAASGSVKAMLTGESGLRIRGRVR